MATMGTPVDYLPAPYSDEVLQRLLATVLPATPVSMRLLRGSGQFHLIYSITYRTQDILQTFHLSPSEVCASADACEALLRVSGNHFSGIKTANEVAVISWLRQNTQIPVPYVLAYSQSSDNVLGQEWILFARSPGETLSNVFRSFNAQQMDNILDQLIDILDQLHAHPWSHVGGLKFAGPAVVPGPVLEETMWFDAEIPKYWPVTESFATLNIAGPFDSYTDYICAHVGKYLHAISVHSSLQFMRDLIPRLQKFTEIVGANRWKLNTVPLRLAHKDLHFGNILVDPNTAKITCIVDWEFAGAVPYTRWNPARAFLWNALDEESSLQEKRDLFDRFKQRCDARGLGHLHKDAEFTCREQEAMQTVQTHLRAIVEACPRGLLVEKAMEWRAVIIQGLEELET